jgi:pyruvate formate lyase activating enzyme
MIRGNEDGILYASEYGNTIAVNIDPIEKKPLYHFKPGTLILSIGPNGCNFGCSFCQNWTISQEKSPTRYISPENLVQLAKSKNSIGVAYTYTEPLIWFEYIYDSARLLRKSGLSVVLVSNGYINEEPARELFPLIDAANIDLKSIRPEFYSRVCKGKLPDVQRTIRLALEMGIHLELTNLLIPKLNDSDEQINELVNWIADLSPKIPLHISRYFPNYRLDNPPTTEERLAFAYETAVKKLRYVYVGNIIGLGGSDTRCHNCGAVLVKRSGYHINIIDMTNGACAACGTKSDIVI